MLNQTSSMKLLMLLNDVAWESTLGSRLATRASENLKPQPFFQIFAISNQGITWSTSITASVVLAVCKPLILDYGRASSCCSITRMRQSCTCLSSVSTWSSVIPAPKVASPNLIDWEVWVGRKPKPKQNARCATWPTSYCGSTLNANLSVVTLSRPTLPG